MSKILYEMYLLNLRIVIIHFSAIIHAVNSNPSFWMPVGVAKLMGNFSLPVGVAKHMGNFSLPVGVAKHMGNFSRNSDVPGFMKIKLYTESGVNCGGYFVAMSICKNIDPG